ncbi:hypothetical protein PR003_g15048 [Phytophthora rubi]|uniref:Uncharacterized protein n=2 Tax=Phytophthora TaxID=4783 RepID=A0A6A3L429_9STRA|nr:hypothetical protein PR002_g15319 [Phytophthora rubi]KAE9331351.1 hypothetical protein PR003_g15048 [Phytophthora rubi]
MQTVARTTEKSIKNKGKHSKTSARPNNRFDKFQRKEAMGQYEALADSDSDFETNDNMDVDDGIEPDRWETAEDDDAPYAFQPEVEPDVGPAHDSSLDCNTMAVEEPTTERIDPVRIAPVDEAMGEPTVLPAARKVKEPSVSGRKDHRGASKTAARIATSAKVTASTTILRRPKSSSPNAGTMGGQPKGLQTTMTRYVQKTAAISDHRTDATGLV